MEIRPTYTARAAFNDPNPFVRTTPRPAVARVALPRYVSQLPGGFMVSLQTIDENGNRFSASVAVEAIVASGFGALEFQHVRTNNAGSTVILVQPNEWDKITGGAK